MGETLIAIFDALDGLEASPHVREMRAKAKSYERIVTRWGTVPPTDPQLDATFELVVELQSQITELKRQRPK